MQNAIAISNLASLEEQLRSALELVTRLKNDLGNPPELRNDAPIMPQTLSEEERKRWRTATGKLTPEGIAFIKEMFNSGSTKTDVRKRMDISPTAAIYWHDKWKEWAIEGHADIVRNTK